MILIRSIKLTQGNKEEEIIILEFLSEEKTKPAFLKPK